MAEQGDNIEDKKKVPNEHLYAQFAQQRFKVIERPGAAPWQQHSHFMEGHKEAVKMTLQDESFENFANDAYAADHNYAIRINPLTGDKEMFIAGTHPLTSRKGVGQWLLNVWDVPVSLLEHPSDVGGPELKWTDDVIKYGREHGFDPIGWLDPWRKKATKRFETIAKREGVDVIYGHSRGGAIVADMKTRPGVKKVGLDAAMLLAGNREMQNYREEQIFDAIIGSGGQANETSIDVGPRFHSVWN